MFKTLVAGTKFMRRSTQRCTGRILGRSRRVRMRDRSFVGISTIRLVGRFDDLDRSETSDRLRAALGENKDIQRSACLDASGNRWLRTDAEPQLDGIEEIVTDSDIVEADKLLLATRQITTGRRSMAVVVGRSHIAFAFSHAFADGSSGSQVIADILKQSAILPKDPQSEFGSATPAKSRTTTRSKMAGIHEKVPMAVAAARLGLHRPVRLKDALQTMRAYELLADERAPTSSTTEELAPQIKMFQLDLSLLDSYRQGMQVADAKQRSLNSIITSEMLRLLSQSVPHDHAMAVAMPMDCRRFVAPGELVRGNFAPAVCIGRLQESWTPELVNDRISQALKCGAPLVVMIRGIRYALRTTNPEPEPDHGGQRRGQTVTISHIRVDPGLDDVLAKLAAIEVGTTGKGRKLQGISIRTERIARTLNVTVTDDSCLIDCNDFAERLLKTFQGRA